MLRLKEKVEENDMELVRINIHSIHLNILIVYHAQFKHIALKHTVTNTNKTFIK